MLATKKMQGRRRKLQKARWLGPRIPARCPHVGGALELDRPGPGGASPLCFPRSLRYHQERLVVREQQRTMPGSSNARLGGLQYVRGLAATMVVLDHTSAMLALPKYLGKVTFGKFFDGGAGGVDIFFTLSGFIIFFVSFSDSFVRKISFRDFILRRFVRIIPFMWVAVLVYAGLQTLGRSTHDFPSVLRAVVLWPTGTVTPNVIWTLRHEFLLFPFRADLSRPRAPILYCRQLARRNCRLHDDSGFQRGEH